MRVRFTRPARADLIDIHRYIAKDDPNAADRVVAGIVERGLSLGSHPHSGRPTDDEGIRVVPLPRFRYLVFYRIAADELQILHVRHMARRPWSEEKRDAERED